MITGVNAPGRLPLVRAAAVLPALLLLAACGEPGDDTSSIDKARAAEYLRTFLIERDWERWPEFFAPNARINGSDLAMQIVRGSADGLNYSFTDLELTITDQLAEPQHVATTFVLEGVHVRPFNDQAATNKRLRIDGFALDRLEGGKVVESRLFIDVFGLTQRARAAAAGR